MRLYCWKLWQNIIKTLFRNHDIILKSNVKISSNIQLEAIVNRLKYDYHLCNLFSFRLIIWEKTLLLETANVNIIASDQYVFSGHQISGEQGAALSPGLRPLLHRGPVQDEVIGAVLHFLSHPLLLSHPIIKIIIGILVKEAIKIFY